MEVEEMVAELPMLRVECRKTGNRNSLQRRRARSRCSSR
jgi:hypothetical protein